MNPRDKKGHILPVPALDRFFSKIDFFGPVPEHRPGLWPCWLWKGYVRPDGYSEIFTAHREHNYIHRFSYEQFHGPIPEGMELDHLCRVRHCAHPDHLEVVTPEENILRGNSPWAINARKTSCPKGHEFNEENTYVRQDGKGKRGCRICRNEARRRCEARIRQAKQQAN